MDTERLLNWHKNEFEKRLMGRYILPEKMNEILRALPAKFNLNIEGKSVLEKPIYSITFGSGKTRVLMWSQMHGNESTTTKSIFDFLALLQDENEAESCRDIFENFTLKIIPILNPDGAEKWTRVNANSVDLNRDAQDLSQPESKILDRVFYSFHPDVCFNLHGQRTIYGFEETAKSSVLSFLSPSADVGRKFTFSRKRAATIISKIQQRLSPYLKGEIGRYDDGFNANCVGDKFQAAGVATVLFEAGHYPGDYEREVTRKFVFVALVNGLKAAQGDDVSGVAAYKNIPEHTKCYCDLHLVEGAEITKVLFREVVKDHKLVFIPSSLEADSGSGKFAHRSIEDEKEIESIKSQMRH